MEFGNQESIEEVFKAVEPLPGKEHLNRLLGKIWPQKGDYQSRKRKLMESVATGTLGVYISSSKKIFTLWRKNYEYEES